MGLPEHRCRKCKSVYEDDEEGDEFGTGLCYVCFEDGVEEYEEKKRRRIEIENEY